MTTEKLIDLASVRKRAEARYYGRTATLTQDAGQITLIERADDGKLVAALRFRTPEEADYHLMASQNDPLYMILAHNWTRARPLIGGGEITNEFWPVMTGVIIALGIVLIGWGIQTIFRGMAG